MALLSAFHNLGGAFVSLFWPTVTRALQKIPVTAQRVGHSDALTPISDATAATTGTVIPASCLALEARGWRLAVGSVDDSAFGAVLMGALEQDPLRRARPGLSSR